MWHVVQFLGGRLCSAGRPPRADALFTPPVLSRALVWAGLCLVMNGCGSRTPPAPPAPPVAQPVAPPPAPEVPTVSEEQTAMCLQPFFYVLFDRGFRPSGVDSPGRYPVAFIDGKIQSSPTQSLAPALQKSIEDAKATTPSLQSLVAAQLRGSTIPIEDAVLEWTQKMPVRSTGTSTYIAEHDARRFILGMYVTQALADAAAQNFHRAHVLLGDVSRVLGADNNFATDEQVADFSRFFVEVPDAPRYESFATRLEQYVRTQEESLIVSGEDAAILHAVGLKEAATFVREKLLCRVTLVILPLLETAILRGQGYGFSPPAQLAELRRRLLGHAETLAGGQGQGGAEPYRMDAKSMESGKDHLLQLEAFEKMVREGRRPGPDGGSVEKVVRALQASPRAVGDWIREKALCAKYCPLYITKPTDESAVIEIGQPLIYAPREESLVAMNLAALAAGDEGTTLGRMIADWCAGGPLPERLQGGEGHFMLAWYWLEHGRPQFTRAALLAGARHLQEYAKATDIERLRADPGRHAAAIGAALQAEFNAYRMLLAAAAISATPVGVPFESGDSYVAELRILMTAWRQSWLKCGLPQSVADAAVRRIDAESRRVSAVESRPQPERYHFFDYRFEHGAVPDVVVNRASEENLVGADGKIRGGDAGMTAFVRSFDLPVEFSKASRVRWGGP